MITRVVHGWRAGGLLAYLLGPGRAEEHRQPRVIASWDGRDPAWQPQLTGPGEYDLELGPLVRALRAPAVAAGLPDRADPAGKRGYVWHCSARVAAGDRVLSDAEWAEIARELLHGAGVAERGDAAGPRWFAIRHADDHIHVAAVLVRQDTARRFSPYRDFPRLRETARAIEERLALTRTAPADGTAARAPGRGEIEKAGRQGRVPARRELLRAVKAAAVAAHDVATFRKELQGAGYLVEIRCAPSGDPIGYKVARPADRSAAGEPIYYSGSKLAADLSLPRLLRMWAAADGRERADADGGDCDALRHARQRIRRARAAVASASRPAEHDAVEDIVHATGDVATAMGRIPCAGKNLAAALDLFDRAARTPRTATARPSPAGDELRRAARRLVRRPWLGSRDEIAGGVALTVALAALMREIATWQRQRGRAHQAAAASTAADAVAAWSGAWSGAPPRPGADRVVVRQGVDGPDAGRAGARPRIDPPPRGASRDVSG